MARTKKRKPGLNRQLRQAAALIVEENAQADGSAQLEQEERPKKRAKKKKGTSKDTPKSTEQATADTEPTGHDEQEATDPVASLDLDPEVVKTHKLTEVRVISSSEIKRKVNQILSSLANINSADTDAKPGMVLVHGDGPTAGKAISIVEIAKNQLEKEGSKCYQYSTVQPHATLIPRVDKASKAKDGQMVADQEESRGTEAAETDHPEEEPGQASNNEEDDAFENMDINPNPDVSGDAAPTDQTHKMRNIPRMMIYFSRVRSEYLKGLYGWVPDSLCKAHIILRGLNL